MKRSLFNLGIMGLATGLVIVASFTTTRSQDTKPVLSVTYTGLHYQCGLQHRANDCAQLFRKWAQMECASADFADGRPNKMAFVSGSNHSPGSVIMNEVICSN